MPHSTGVESNIGYRTKQDIHLNLVPIQFLMGQHGYRVMIAERGEDALDLNYHYKPDLAKLDIMLPEIEGYPVFANILHSASNFNFTSFPSKHQYLASSPIAHCHIVAEK